MFNTIKQHVHTLILAPIIIVQGKYVKKVTPELPEAKGERSGIIGKGKLLRLLIVGDSAAAGVGAEYQEQALMGQLAETLSQKYKVDWKLLAKSGVTTSESTDMVAEQEKQSIDVIVTSLGVNDITSNLSVTNWLKQQQTFISLLRERFDNPQILVTKVPPMHQFPALPQPLRGYLGERARQFNHHLTQWIETQQDCQLIEINGELINEHMASDGFHPGPKGYKYWAEVVALKIDV